MCKDEFLKWKLKHKSFPKTEGVITYIRIPFEQLKVIKNKFLITFFILILSSFTLANFFTSAHFRKALEGRFLLPI